MKNNYSATADEGDKKVKKTDNIPRVANQSYCYREGVATGDIEFGATIAPPSYTRKHQIGIEL